MRKLLVFLMIVFLASNSYAARVTKPNTFSAGQTISSADVNDDFDTIYNEFNGSIEGGASGNIAADTITELEMADDANPRVRWDEGFQDFVYTGLVPATSGTLTSNISAGTTYVDGYRVNKASATSHTYTASKDTYVDISNGGVFTYSEVALGAAAPAVTADSIRLAAVTTTATLIQSVTDLRTLTPYATGSSAHIITRGFELVYASATTVTVNPGTLYHNVTQVNKTSTTTLDTTAAGDYIAGSDEGDNGEWIYVYSDSSGNLKLDDTAPNYSDTAGSTAGTKLYLLVGSTYYRCIGGVKFATGTQNILNFYQNGNKVQYDDPYGTATMLVLNNGGAVGFTNVDCSAAVPAISTLCELNINWDGVAALYIRKDGSSATSGRVYNRSGSQAIFVDVPLSTAQIFEYKVSASTVDIYVSGYTMDIR